MESSTKTDVASQPKKLVDIDVISYDEDIEEITTQRILGSQPRVKLNLSNVHYLTVVFNSTTNVFGKYTELELSTLVEDMKPYVGVKLEFFNNSKVSHTDCLLSDCKLMNVYKYDSVKVSLCTQKDLSVYFDTTRYWSSDESSSDISSTNSESDNFESCEEEGEN